MKKLVLICMVLLFSAVSAYAMPVTDDLVKVANGTYGTTAGGEFIVTTTGSGGNHSFTTFCLEYNEHISYSGQYYVDTVSDYATLGGGGAVSGMDELSEATKWVYWNYLQGTFGSGDTVADNVQKTIWQLEEENWERKNDESVFETFFQGVSGRSDYSINGIVKVLNIVDINGNPMQSQIIAEPVPEPATMILFGTGLVGLVAARRRKTKK